MTSHTALLATVLTSLALAGCGGMYLEDRTTEAMRTRHEPIRPHPLQLRARRGYTMVVMDGRTATRGVGTYGPSLRPRYTPLDPLPSSATAVASWRDRRQPTQREDSDEEADARSAGRPDLHRPGRARRVQGDLASGVQATFNLSVPANGASAATVMTVKKSKLAVLGALTAAAGSAVQIVSTLPKVERVIITVDIPPGGGTSILQVTQSGNVDQY